MVKMLMFINLAGSGSGNLKILKHGADIFRLCNWLSEPQKLLFKVRGIPF